MSSTGLNGTSGKAGSTVDLHNLHDPRSLAVLTSSNRRKEREREERRKREALRRSAHTSRPKELKVNNGSIQTSADLRQKETEQAEILKQKELAKAEALKQKELKKAEALKKKELRKAKQTSDIICLLFGISSLGMSILSAFGSFFVISICLGIAGIVFGVGAKKTGYATMKRTAGMILSILAIVISLAAG